MKRNLVLTLMALFVAIVGVRPLYAQDLGIAPTNVTIPGVGNRGSVGAGFNGFLNSNAIQAAGLQPNGNVTFNVTDIAVTPGGIFAISADDVTGPLGLGGPDGLIDQGRFTRLTAVTPVPDGTFGFPIVVNLTAQTGALLTSINIGDLDFDGRTDFMITGNNGTRVISGRSIAGLGLGSADVLITNGIGVAPVGVQSVTAASVTNALSGSIGRINGDAIGDLAIASAGNMITVVNTNPANPAMPFTGIPPVRVITTTGTIGLGAPLATGFTPTPRLLTITTANLLESAATPQVDNDFDVVVATSLGVEVFEQSLSGTAGDVAFVTAVGSPLTAGTQPVGVVDVDVNGDTRVDLIALNRGSGSLSTFIASAATTGGYAAPLTSLAGVNPNSLRPLNFNNDGRLDIVVTSPPSGAVGSTGLVSVLTGNGAGAFTLATQFRVPNPTSVAVGRLDATSTTDDIVVASGDGPVGVVGANAAFTGGILYLSAGAGYSQVFLNLFASASLAADFDGQGGLNDIVFIEQNSGIVFVLQNLSTAGAPQIGVLVVRDLFTAAFIPTSATSFRDALTGASNLAVTVVPPILGAPQIGIAQILVGINLGGGLFADIRQFRQFPATSGATNILNGDFNNDGFDDLAFVDFDSGIAAVALNDGTNLFFRLRTTETGGSVPVSAILVDVNNNDSLDLLVLNRGSGRQFDQSNVVILDNDGMGNLTLTGRFFQVPNFGLSLVGGPQDVAATTATASVRRIVDFNEDGMPDFAVASTAGAVTGIGVATPSVTVFLNSSVNPGTFTAQNPIALIDNTPAGTAIMFNLGTNNVGALGVSGRLGIDVTGDGFNDGIGLGGANFIMTVGDYNADGVSDLVVGGSVNVGALLGTVTVMVPTRASIYILGNGSGNMVVARPLFNTQYGAGVGALGDTFVSATTGNFAPLANRVPDVVHLSVNGSIFIDQNISSILNHAPIASIRRDPTGADATALNGPIGSGDRVTITAGQMRTVQVRAFDPDGDAITFSIIASPTGEQPPSFVRVDPMTGLVTIDTSRFPNPGPSNAVFRIFVQASDNASRGAGGRQDLTDRASFTLVVRPNTAPTIAPIANQTVQAGSTSTVALNISDAEGNTVTTAVRCDRGTFVTAAATTLTIAPQAGDVGTTTCTVTATDQFGLASTATFVVTVTAPNVAPSIGALADVTLRAGETRTITVTATDPNMGDTIALSLVSGPTFATFRDNQNGTGTITLAPAATETMGGRVTIQARDRGGLTATASFNVTVTRAVTITAASYRKPNFSITGTGFAAGATIQINGMDITSRAKQLSVTATQINFRGSKKKLNIRTGANTVTVTVGGVTSAPVTFNAVADGDE